MAHVRYISRTSGAHDQRWVETLRSADHDVVVAWGQSPAATLEALRADPTPCDLVVAGPLTDMVPVAVEADIAPVLAIAWAFDALVEAEDARVHDRMATSLQRVAGVHVDCRDLAERLVRLGVNTADISEGAWGIDTSFFSPGPVDAALRETHGWAGGDVVVVSTRAWEPLYAVEVVLDGVAAARGRDPRIRLALLGEGSLAPQVHARIEQSDLRGAVATPGRVQPQQLLRWLRGGDVYVAASRSDGSSLSLLEALACGLPAVVPRFGGNPEWVTDQRLGQLFVRDDPEELAAGLAEVIDRLPSGADDVSARRHRVLHRGDWRVNRGLFLTAVDRVLGKRQP